MSARFELRAFFRGVVVAMREAGRAIWALCTAFGHAILWVLAMFHLAIFGRSWGSPVAR